MTSLWLGTAPSPERPGLDAELSVEVAVLGGGIVGLTTALLLQPAMSTIAVIEADRVGAGVTGHTTAKLSSLHGLTYAKLRSGFGEDGARKYAAANEAGIAQVAALVEEHRVDCGFARRPAFTYAESEDEVGSIHDEVEAAREAGLAASFTTETDLPFHVAGAVRVDDQAEFHPYRYLLALADAFERGGGRIFERTRATGVEDGSPVRIETERGHVVAEHVIVATHIPFLDRGLYFARMHPERSYALAARVRGPLPQGMYLSSGQPAHSIRSHGDWLIVGGESHKTGQGGSTAERYERLEVYARDRFEVESVDYRWAAQDYMPSDGVPFIGTYAPGAKRLYTATGFKKWGLAAGTAAAVMLRDQVLGRQNPWASLFDPGRLKPLAGGMDFIKENANVVVRFIGDRLRRGDRPVCTHMGCVLSWNDGDRSWDCPCHGSRFGPDGTVLHGPAVRALEDVPPAPPGQP